MKSPAIFMASVIIVLIALLPIAFLVTILCAPLWLWIEHTLHIEIIGHSGPAEWCYLLIYVLCVCFALCFYTKITLLAFFGVLIIITILVFPLPHGGSFGAALMVELGDAIADIWQDEIDDKEKNLQQHFANQALEEKLTGRFSGALELNILFPLKNPHF